MRLTAVTSLSVDGPKAGATDPAARGQERVDLREEPEDEQRQDDSDEGDHDDE